VEGLPNDCNRVVHLGRREYRSGRIASDEAQVPVTEVAALQQIAHRGEALSEGHWRQRRRWSIHHRLPVIAAPGKGERPTRGRDRGYRRREHEGMRDRYGLRAHGPGRCAGEHGGRDDRQAVDADRDDIALSADGISRA
jgi:hypothetical protein